MGGWMGSRTSLNVVEGEKILMLLLGIKYWPLSLEPITIPVELS
jgi:hypothetical protein